MINKLLFIFSLIFIYPLTNVSAFSKSDFKIDANERTNASKWNTINHIGRNQCGRNGWIRKFADGTNDWTNANRLMIDPSNMSCLNTSTSLSLEKPDKVSISAYNRDFFRLCEDPSQNGCTEISMQSSNGFDVINPVFDINFGGNLEIIGGARIAAMNTFLFDNNNGQRKTFFTPFLPTFVDGDGPRNENSLNNFFDASKEYLSVRLPSYINGEINIANVYSTDTFGRKSQQLINCETAGLCSVCDPSQNQDTEWIAGVTGDNRSWWCYNESTGILHAKRARKHVSAMPAAGLYIEFYPVNTPDHRYGSAKSPVLEPYKTGVYKPGNDLYYLTKLARLELIGIPQIFFEPIYCNSNVNKIVPHIFHDNEGNDITTRSQFEKTAYTYHFVEGKLSQIYDSNADGVDLLNSLNIGTSEVQYIVNKENLSHPEIFSHNEFRCCLNLGATTSSANKCCSNFMDNEVSGDDKTPTICKLPVSTDLNVYFNRFVSDDGANADPSIGLMNDDFIAKTGEPKLQSSTFTKLRALGEKYCAIPATRLGSAFGEFASEPNGGSFLSPLENPLNTITRYNFVDSVSDFAPSFNDSPASLQFFNAGFRWNHHVYCADRRPYEI